MIDQCPSCLGGGSIYKTLLHDGVCYFCWKAAMRPEPQPIVTPCPRRTPPQEALR